MKLPFVSREAFDLLYAELQRAAERERAWEVRYESLAAQLLRATEKPSLPKPERDPVTATILQRAGADGRLRTHLAAWAMKERRNGTPDDDIIQRILVWGDPGEDVSPDGPA